MSVRTLIAGIVGGVVLFIWGSVAHVALPLGEVGFSSSPNEDAVLEAMRANITQPGLYFLPWLGPEQRTDEAAMQAWAEKAKRGPVAFVVYQTRGEGEISPAQLGVEFGSNLLIGLLAAVVLANLTGAFAVRVVMAGLMGLMSSLDVFVSQWNWYKFPADYSLAQAFVQVVGFVLMGAAIAAISKQK
jgi:hypothetical protein